MTRTEDCDQHMWRANRAVWLADADAYQVRFVCERCLKVHVSHLNQRGELLPGHTFPNDEETHMGNTSTTQEHIEGGFRFTLARGSSFIAVKHTDALSNAVPYDMMEIPDWINRTALDDEGFRILCALWFTRMKGQS